ncbi:hypothetical protein C8Q74DRAFT_309634 [Fomes fomentarius]|nr:hypothetical protein C8Q74DRAFT_309634 [Fomes fomentarius]
MFKLTVALFIFSLLSTVFAHPTVEALDEASGRLVRREDKLSNQDLLASCPGAPGSSNVRRADRCTLINIVNNRDRRIWTVLGDPQLNCGGATDDITVTLGGEQTVSETTTINANFGIDFDGISIGGGVSETTETSTTMSKSIEFSIPPGRQAVYVAGVLHKSETGRVQVNYGSKQRGHYIWFTGTTVTKLTPISDDVQFDVFETNCGRDPRDLSNLPTSRMYKLQ